MFRLQLRAIGWHVFAWLLFSSLIIAFVRTSGSGNSSSLSGNYLLFLICFSGIFYLNYLLLIPRLYFQTGYIAYAVSISVIGAMILFLQPFDRLMNDHRMQNFDSFSDNRRPPPPGINPFPPPRPSGNERPDDSTMRKASPRFDIISLILFIMMITASAALRIRGRWRESEHRILQAESERTKAELSFLKAQINPHFLFNSLNNIYSMAMSSHPDTPTAILKLSKIMRYATEEAGTDLVSLAAELECIRDYIDLQKIRLNEKVPVEFKVTGTIGNQEIAPFIFINFIENAFKYGISLSAPSAIIISINIINNIIYFQCKNGNFRRDSPFEGAGLGLANTKARLEHIYPDKYKLEIIDDEGIYQVKLSINLS